MRSAAEQRYKTAFEKVNAALPTSLITELLHAEAEMRFVTNHLGMEQLQKFPVIVPMPTPPPPALIPPLPPEPAAPKLTPRRCDRCHMPMGLSIAAGQRTYKCIACGAGAPFVEEPVEVEAVSA